MLAYKNGPKRFVVITPKSRSVSHPLGLYDNHDADGLRLYGVGHGTLFYTRKDAAEAAKVWPGAAVIEVRLVPVEPLPNKAKERGEG